MSGFIGPAYLKSMLPGQLPVAHDQVSPVYTIRQVTELTQVPENTLRSWERRYGIPEPLRSAGNQRRYPEGQIDLILRIQAAREDGLAMDQAIARARGSGEIVRREAPLQSEPVSDSQLPWEDQRTAMAHLLTSGSWQAADLFLRECRWTTSIDHLVAELIVPVGESIRQRYQLGEISQSVLQLAEAWIIRKLYAGLDSLTLGASGAPILVLSLGHSMMRGLAISISAARLGHVCIPIAGPTTREQIPALIASALPALIVVVVESDEAIPVAATIARQIHETHAAKLRVAVHSPSDKDIEHTVRIGLQMETSMSSMINNNTGANEARGDNP